MNRRLNPELFNSTPTGPSDVQGSQYTVLATRQMEKELKETKKRVSHLESLLEVVQSQIRSFSDSNEKRTGAFSKALSELEQGFREQDLRRNRELKNLETRLRDQKIVDGQMESMIERFNMSLMQFENKLSSLQKVISEKQMTLISYRSIIEKIVDEVEKIKDKQNRPNFPLR